jgi:hypothetical protein
MTRASKDDTTLPLTLYALPFLTVSLSHLVTVCGGHYIAGSGLVSEALDVKESSGLQDAHGGQRESSWRSAE